MTATGLFTTNAFTVPIAVGDDIIIMSGRIAAISEKKTVVDSILADTAGRKIQKNVALAGFEFLMIDSADHITPKAGLGVGVTGTRSIDGAAFGACANAVAEVSDGVYTIDLAAGDLNGDVITFVFTAAGADATTITIVTQA